MRGLARVAVLIFLSAGGALAGQGFVSVGEGVGRVESFNPLGPTVVIDGRAVRLSAKAAATLREQIPKQGWSAGEAFGAEYIVSRDPAGLPIVDRIYVFRKRK